MRRITAIFLLLFSVGTLWTTAPLFASDITSTHFIIRDPVVGTGGGYGTSSSFGLFSAGNMNLSARNSSTNFKGHFGFLYFPTVTDVTLTATPNGADADLSWPAAVSATGLGWTVAGYNTGIATVSGGPYTYTDVGNVTSYTYSTLTPGDYCFILQTYDALGNVIATSNEECITIQPILTFSISDAAVQFGTLSVSGARYATTSGGSSSDSADAHTITASSNAPGGYTITYYGPTLTSGPHTIPGGTNISGGGSPGTAQFGISLSTNGSASIPSGYQHSGPTWSFVASTPTTVASTSTETASETFGVRYIANISSSIPAGSYSTNLTYVITGDF